MSGIRYILWHVKHFVLLALGTNLLLGNLCMMPMAMAEEMSDMPGMNHDMSAMASHEDQPDRSEQMPCDGEHCIVPALPTQTSLVTDGMFTVALPITPNVVAFSFAKETPVPMSTAPPGQFIHVRTIVLRN